MLSPNPNANSSPMELCASVAPLPESGAPPTFPSEPTLPGNSTDPVPLQGQAGAPRTAEIIADAEKAQDGGAQENQRRRYFFAGRGRHHFRGGRGRMRWRGGARGVAPCYPKANLASAPLETGDSAAKGPLPPPSSPPFIPWCDVCHVDCNTAEVLEKHKTGKRHKRTLQLLEQMAARHLDPTHDNRPIQDGLPEEASVVAEGTIPTMTGGSKKKRKRGAEAEQARVCLLCNAACNSEAMFAAHLAGKKHASRINRYQIPNTIYGPIVGYAPPDGPSASASQAAAQPPLYFGLVTYDECLNPQPEQPGEREPPPLSDTGAQCGFTGF